MFKTMRWRSEKNRIKAVFKLHFQATQVPSLGWDALMVAVVPLEVGKPTVKSEKASVHGGICRWEKPIYETVRFVQEPKTGKINEKIYHFHVSTGLSKASFVGQVAVDFANYAEATEASSVSLPLKTSNFSIVLHITIQRIQATSDGRVAEQNGDVMVRSDGKIKSQLSSSGMDGNCQDSDGVSLSNFTEDPNLSHGNIPEKEQVSLVTQAQLSLSITETLSSYDESNNIPRESSCSDAISASSLDSSSGQENSQELGLRSNNTQLDMASVPSPLCSDSTPLNQTAELISSEDTILKERLWCSDISIEKLKIEIGVLARQAEVSQLELETLRKQVVKERRRGQDLSREVRNLQEQREALKRECEQLKSLQVNIDSGKFSNQFWSDNTDQLDVLQEIRKELNHEKDLNAGLRLQLQKTQESNSELILAVQNLEGLLRQRNKKAAIEPTTNESPQEIKIGICGPHLLQAESSKELWDIASNSKHEMDDEEQQALEELVKEHGDTSVAYSLEQKIMDLCSEIEMYKKDNEELEMQMEQLALDYEIVKQENHSMSSKLRQNQAEEQLEMEYECPGSLDTINDLEIHAEKLEKELEKQAEAFEADLVAITRAKVEQEQRAIRAEEALRKMKWNNAKTAENLQEDFKTLSMQVSSRLSVNEKLLIQTLTEASVLRVQKSNLEELLEKADQELGLVHEFYKSKVKELANEICLQSKRTNQLLLELKEKFKELENQRKSNAEKDKAASEEILMLETQMSSLMIENKNLSAQVEQKEKLRVEREQMKTSFDDVIMLLQRGNIERNELETKVASMSKEAEKSLEELNDMKCLKDEKEKTIRCLQSELAVLQAQYNDLKYSLLKDEDELGKENIVKQVFHLKSGLQNKDDAITIVNKQLKDHSAIITVEDGTLKPNSTNIRKENELCNRIGEEEKAMGELNQNNQCFCENKFQRHHENQFVERTQRLN
eukprot:TRINITY_DN34381_c2_g2_i9.p1 TRINITY_DN34381_c2_g2~~TRINITY_DN34381_c2_g2_i9.p1  ORF type:complete len:957 (-),score=237.24 TRINITY_DN34381_c2_g2_i9:468-3338(-)